jgi:hypothetical protein
VGLNIRHPETNCRKNGSNWTGSSASSRNNDFLVVKVCLAKSCAFLLEYILLEDFLTSTSRNVCDLRTANWYPLKAAWKHMYSTQAHFWRFVSNSTFCECVPLCHVNSCCHVEAPNNNCSTNLKIVWCEQFWGFIVIANPTYLINQLVICLYVDAANFFLLLHDWEEIAPWPSHYQDPGNPKNP